MLTSGLAGGARGAVGGTYNFATPLYIKIKKAFLKGDVEKAQQLQALSVEMVRIMFQYRGLPAFKATVNFIGVDCGPPRLPHKPLTTEETESLKSKMEQIGFFEWGRR